MKDEAMRDWVDRYIDRIWSERIDRLTLSQYRTPAEFCSVVAGLRDELADTLRERLLLGDKVSEVKAGIQAMLELDKWLHEHRGSGGVKAARITPADLTRAEKIIAKARGGDA